MVVSAAGRRLVLLGELGHDRFGGEKQAGDRSGVLQRAAGHLGRVDNAGLDEVHPFVGGDVEAFVALAALGLADDERAFEPGIVRELADALGGEIVAGGPEIVIGDVNEIAAAKGLDLVFAEDEASAVKAVAGAAAAVVLKPGCLGTYARYPAMGVVEADQPRLWFARAAHLIKPAPSPAGVHASAVIGALAELGNGVTVAAGAVIGECASIGAGTRIEAGAVIGPYVHIGSTAAFIRA